jgi:hypothetical protein
LYEGLPQLCASISKACGDYGTAVGNARLEADDAAANPIAALVEVAALRAALAQTAGNLLKAVSVIAVGALADHLVTSVNAESFMPQPSTFFRLRPREGISKTTRKRSIQDYARARGIAA